ncbi:MAG: hypothetical protein A3J09_00050 [Candidatus Zambryskibacteria bacterium RIFCSPLOWO2_02_FULL_51_21]|uniref:Glycosyl transferase family 1 domain-containing protein n=1 Tax=Candidatus Zambryskibacteria bacterium RIFCSPHIGHO2_02_FULL_43_37 TaxID=1802749 RepID=A0A1G2TI27_9BACT|nr:MAG: hypothetical protein A2723_00050 [Candidatus Zambryskibacteria bacterium RIFCSPHIGHO2_01_FULL_52_18]OHA96852.1 MAG: hypothetical protein A3D49_01950 [Candidatus Zambryskibacteria bacterium RIFCSPHIGHO2_02_FULL_43_37]OHB07089.1 MAG: hypothetical protein A2944_02410 [Candidatus Zambryskibacteria bacterium RIFCSPLOWO2_01_FULL_52_12]OHB10964.1 MAG: hypothetical protein A3J09_00050 [Candidatus Zambryskibacteria bacterium RIFCSPLOWO2_02_FULL_51_21]
MKLLVITQKVDKNDPVLGFFHRWLEEFAKHYESIIVICLEKGAYDLPNNVKVLSLGKEDDGSRSEYILKFYKYIWEERENYDAVFVHMNQEYVILAGDLWRLLGKKIYLWRNHAKGNILTDLAVLLSHKVFCTSPSSYTAKFKKTVLMPAGIDTDFFRPDPRADRVSGSILCLGRLAPVKKVLEFVDWLKDRDFKTATIAGGALPQDVQYEKDVRDRVAEYGLGNKVKFVGPVTQSEAKTLYQTHETYVNFTPAGSFDKTIIEAAACGAKLVVENPDLQDVNPAEHSMKKLMERLAKELN